MTALERAKVVALDFETTGQVKGQLNLPWQIGMVRIIKGKVVPEEGFSRYLRVPADYHFSPYTPGRWAEMRDELAQCNSLVQEWPEVGPWLEGAVLVAHNAPTERKMLRQAFPMHEFGPWIDTLRLARLTYKLESYALSDLLETLALKQRVDEMCPGLTPHDAFYDAVGCACLLEHLCTTTNWGEWSVELLSRV